MLLHCEFNKYKKLLYHFYKFMIQILYLFFGDHFVILFQPNIVLLSIVWCNMVTSFQYMISYCDTVLI